MLYLLSCLVVMVYLLNRMYSTLKDRIENLDDSRSFRPGAITTFVTIGAVCLLLSPMYISLVMESITPNVSLMSQWAGVAGGLALIGVYGWSFLKKRSFASGLISICGAILFFIFANSLLFISKNNTGVLNYGYVSRMAKISDVECDKEAMIVNIAEKNSPSEWRCPKDFVLLGLSSKPFIPWPTYTTGKSLELSKVMHAMMDNAVDASKQVEQRH